MPKLSDFFHAQKAFSHPFVWVSAPRGRCEFLAQLDADGLVSEGLRLRGIAETTRREAGVLFQLEYDGPGRKCEPLSRIEWRPDGYHVNRNCGPEEWEGIPQLGTHYHKFELNYIENRDAMKRNCRESEPVVPDIADYEDLRIFIMREFTISGDSASIPYPPWSEALF